MFTGTLLAVLLIREKLGENIDLSALGKLLEKDVYRKNYYLDLGKPKILHFNIILDNV